MSISAVVLAGGKSSRMGQDKALLPFSKYSSLAEYQYKRLEPLFKKIYISSKVDKFDFKADIIYDKYPDSNPLNAIISAFETVNADAIFFISVDMPLLSINSIEQLKNLYSSEPNFNIYLIKNKNQIEPMAAIYKKDILSKAKEMYKNEDYKLKELIFNFNYTTLEIENRYEVININKKNEYKNALNYLNKKN